MNKYIDFAALFHVLAVSLLAGAGLVALYAFGLVGLAAGRDKTGSTVSETQTAGTLLAVFCFGIVAVGVALALWVIIKS